MENHRVRSSILRSGTIKEIFKMNIDFFNQLAPQKIFQSAYLFEKKPAPMGLYELLVIPFLLAVIFAFLMLVFLKKKEEPEVNFLKKIVNLLFFFGLIGSGLVFFRWQGISYLGSRFLLVILGVLAAIWLIKILWYKFVIYPKERREYQKKKIFEKYLP